MTKTVRLPVKHHTPAGSLATHWARSLLTALAAMATFSASGMSQSADTKTQPATFPAIARIAGVRVGVDTLKTLQARLGAGLPMSGARGYTWTWPAANCVIRATFDPPSESPTPPDHPVAYSDVVRAVSMEVMPPTVPGTDTDGAPVRGYVRDLGWMGAVIPGTDRARLLKAASKLPRPETHGAEMIWRASPPQSGHSEAEAAMRWAAVVRLKDEKVASIRVVAL